MLLNGLNELRPGQDPPRDARYRLCSPPRPVEPQGIPEGVEASDVMSEDDIRAAAERLDESIQPFSRLFGKEGARRHARTYLKGLMSPLGRKSIEPIAQAVGGGRASALQKFINVAPWRAGAVQKEVQRAFGVWLRDHPRCPVVHSVREYGFAKKGRESVGVARQWNAATGRKENCQVGVFLVGTAAGASCLLDGRLYLPASWFDGSEVVRRRRERTHVPIGTHYRTKWQIALDLLRRCTGMGLVEPDWVVAGEGFFGHGDIHNGVDSLDRPYLIGVPPSEVVFTEEVHGHKASDPGGPMPYRREIAQTVSSLCEGLPADAWRGVALRGGARTTYEEYATVRVRSPLARTNARPLWLVLRRGPDPGCASLRYYFSSARPQTPPDAVAAALAVADASGAFFTEADKFLGMSHYETRSWDGWHHHMSLVALAHWFATSAGPDLSRDGGADGASTPRNRVGNLDSHPSFD
jgi:hypothetical protein